MATEMKIDCELLARDVELPVAKTSQALSLLDEGNTVAFITRYRKDQTGGLDEEQIRSIQVAAAKRRQLADRKTAILKSLAAQQKLSPQLQTDIENCDSVKQLEDLYLPYRPKKRTLATVARQRGLEPLAQAILEDRLDRSLEAAAAEHVSAERDLPTPGLVIQGVRHILAEQYSESAALRAALRPPFRETGFLVTARAVAAEPTGSPTESERSGRSKRRRKGSSAEAAFQDYFAFREAFGRVPPHRVLAINRGEREKVLRVRVEAPQEPLIHIATELLVSAEHQHADLLRGCVRDALTRLVLPSLERELRRELTERAETHAVRVFAKNLRNLLLQPPVRGRRILAIDPGFRSGNKLAVLDAFGDLIEHGLTYIVGREEVIQEGRRKLVAMVERHDVSLIAIGNGTACRETEKLVAEVISNELRQREAHYVIVNEAGASVYSTSAIGREELPDHDPVVRSAISIGRRLLDPLSELVKINPANIGVGMYQHDVKAKPLRETLDAVVESCVNFVGVDLNTASPALMSYVSGLNQLTARRVYEYRRDHGPFQTREQLKEVPGIGEASFVQAAGFLRVAEGANPLDATWIHPESYPIAHRLLAELGSNDAELAASLASAGSSPKAGTLAARAAGVDVPRLASKLEVGQLLLSDLIAALTRPGLDPREDLPRPVFRQEIVKLDDLKPGMKLRGTVLNVVDFGAFVDVGISESALVHVSRLTNRFVSDPHDVVGVGDVVTVWVVEIDKQRRRVSLTAIPPEQRSPPQPAAGSTQQRKDLGRAAKTRPPHKRSKKKAEPPPPISESMVNGSEPLRSFSDLLQYYEQQNSPGQKGARD